MVLLEWALDVLHSLEDWRWLWSLEPATTPLSSLTPQSPPLLSDASSASLWTMYTLTVPNTSVPSINESPLDTLNAPTPCTPVQSVESLVMWAPVAQPQPQLACHLSLPEWATWEDLELVPQGYDRGNAMVEEVPDATS